MQLELIFSRKSSCIYAVHASKTKFYQKNLRAHGQHIRLNSNLTQKAHSAWFTLAISCRNTTLRPHNHEHATRTKISQEKLKSHRRPMQLKLKSHQKKVLS